MTNKEAIKYLIKPVSTSTSDGEEKQKEFEAYKMAIEALEKLPCDPCLMSDKKLEECNDAISRSEAIRVASGYCHWANIPKELAKLPSVNPKPCEDVISRQAVLDAFYNRRPTLATDNYSLEKDLKDLPSVTQKTGWIPASIVTPKEDEYVLCTVKDTKHPIIIAKYEDKPWWNHIKAWMPLPEPFKEVEE